MNLELSHALSAASAVGTFLAAGAAWWSARAAEKAARGSLVTKLHDEWWQYEIKKAKRTLKIWKKSHGEPAGFEKFGELYRASESNTLSGDDVEEFELVDEARRAIKAYFRKVYQLHTENYISKSDVMNILAPESRIGILINTLEGFEIAKGEKHNDKLFEYFSGLYEKNRKHVNQGTPED